MIPSQILQFKLLSYVTCIEEFFSEPNQKWISPRWKDGAGILTWTHSSPPCSPRGAKSSKVIWKSAHTHSAQSMEKIMLARRTQRHIIHLVERCWAQELPFLYANQLRRCWMQVCMTVREISPTVPEGHFSPLPAKDNAQLYFACVCVSRCFVPQAVRTRLLVGDKNTIMRRGKYDFSNVNSSWAEGRQEMEKTQPHFIAP